MNLRLSSTDGRAWDLSRDFVTSTKTAIDQGWLICEGEGTQLITERAPDSPLVKEQASLRNELAAFDAAMCHGLREGGIPGTKYEGYHDARFTYAAAMPAWPPHSHAVSPPSCPICSQMESRAVGDWTLLAGLPLPSIP
ncbi:hypothetical protein [Verrucomicrobium spinosum]|uniref:hypothetical protein n=1 Tax=Verrucomicrobium spinosum TaxID=2736 RepID=UPI0009463ADD|nr:hypothetical protein [Verrucomicrobium spinosum]